MHEMCLEHTTVRKAHLTATTRHDAIKLALVLIAVGVPAHARSTELEADESRAAHMPAARHASRLVIVSGGVGGRGGGRGGGARGGGRGGGSGGVLVVIQCGAHVEDSLAALLAGYKMSVERPPARPAQLAVPMAPAR